MAKRYVEPKPELEWLRYAVVGDQVIVVSRSHKAVTTIERLTEMWVITSNGSRYRKHDGYMVGGDEWHQSHLTKPTPELLAEIEKCTQRDDSIRYLNRVDWSALVTPVLLRLVNIIKAAKAARAGERKPANDRD